MTKSHRIKGKTLKFISNLHDKYHLNFLVHSLKKDESTGVLYFTTDDKSFDWDEFRLYIWLIYGGYCLGDDCITVYFEVCNEVIFVGAYDYKHHKKLSTKVLYKKCKEPLKHISAPYNCNEKSKSYHILLEFIKNA